MCSSDTSERTGLGQNGPVPFEGNRQAMWRGRRWVVRETRLWFCLHQSRVRAYGLFILTAKLRGLGQRLNAKSFPLSEALPLSCS